MYDLTRFRLSDMVECEAALRNVGVGARTMEEAAGRIVRWLYENLRHGTDGERACALGRFFKTHPFEALPPARAPMISQLIRQLGLQIHTVLHPEPSILIDAEQRNFNVFFVADALGSPHIPAQKDFVEPYGIRSVLGFGGLLLRGDLFAVVMFSHAPIGSGIAEMFRTAALAVKIAVLPFAAGPVFVSNPSVAANERS